MPSRSRHRSRGRSRRRHHDDYDDERSRSSRHSRSRSRSDSRDRAHRTYSNEDFTVLQYERVEEVLLDRKGRRTGMRNRDIVTMAPASQVLKAGPYQQKRIEYSPDPDRPIPMRDQYPSCSYPVRTDERWQPAREEGTGSKLKRFFGLKGEKQKPEFGSQYGDVAVPYHYYNSAYEHNQDQGGRYY
ncbi:hypothetical protein CPB85DRAFT_360314 [Mucidula mucida]|nr:hypothetical protein CPB85DRAFT_360314 [Mucidula mucida]